MSTGIQQEVYTAGPRLTQTRIEKRLHRQTILVHRIPGPIERETITKHQAKVPHTGLRIPVPAILQTPLDRRHIHRRPDHIVIIRDIVEHTVYGATKRLACAPFPHRLHDGGQNVLQLVSGRAWLPCHRLHRWIDRPANPLSRLISWRLIWVLRSGGEEQWARFVIVLFLLWFLVHGHGDAVMNCPLWWFLELAQSSSWSGLISGLVGPWRTAFRFDFHQREDPFRVGGIVDGHAVEGRVGDVHGAGACWSIRNSEHALELFWEKILSWKWGFIECKILGSEGNGNGETLEQFGTEKCFFWNLFRSVAAVSCFPWQFQFHSIGDATCRSAVLYLYAAPGRHYPIVVYTSKSRSKQNRNCRKNVQGVCNGDVNLDV